LRPIAICQAVKLHFSKKQDFAAHCSLNITTELTHP